MPETGCENCKLRQKYDKNPKSWGGRFWRFHIAFCPGWKQYMNEVAPEQRQALARQYNLKKYMS